MHAASVYPEPGSNSLNMIYQGYLSNHHTEFVCSSYFVRALFLNSKEFSESFTFRHCCSIFKELRFPPFGGQLYYYIKTVFLCQVLFSKFFKFFRSAQSCSYRPSFLCLLFGFVLSALADSFVIISILLPFVNRFFHLFSPSTFLTTPSSSLVLFCAFGYKRKRSFYLSSFCFIT